MKSRTARGKRVLAVLALCVLPALAGPVLQADEKKDDDWMAGRLFAPELLLAHRVELNLSDAQRDTLRREIVAVQSRVPEIDYEMLDRATAVQAMLDKRPIDDKAVLAEVDRLLQAEMKKKELYLAMLINLRNMLTPAQIDAARALGGRKP
ncbi:MAG: hypothetical protein RL684_2430 [Pseudomonadota bacterium]|jgi:Spy/CpxP family protein refolding chaperone